MADLLDEDSRSIVSSIDFVARSLVRVANDINPDIEVAVADPIERAKLDFLLLNSKDLTPAPQQRLWRRDRAYRRLLLLRRRLGCANRG